MQSFGSVSVSNYRGGPTRAKARCELHFEDATVGHDVTARSIEVDGKKCRITRCAQRPSMKLDAARAVLDKADDDRGPGASPRRQLPSRLAVVAALEALDDAGALDASRAVAALAAVGETRRALALWQACDESPAARGAGVAAHAAAGLFDEALALFKKGDVDMRGYNAAMACAEAVGDYPFAFSILQQRAKHVQDTKRNLEIDALNAKRDWLESSSS